MVEENGQKLLVFQGSPYYTMHKDAPHVFLATNDQQVMRGGSRADITPTILDRLGVNTSHISPPLDGESLARPATRPPAKREVVVQGKGKGKKKKSRRYPLGES